MAITQDSNCSGESQSDYVPPPDDAIVISGISTIMPDCEDIDVFAKKLYDKVNLAQNTERRWDYDQLPKYFGVTPNVDRFDCHYFMMHPRFADNLEPTCRKFMELSYQAIFDSGVCPSDMYTKKVGVFACPGGSERNFMIVNSQRIHYFTIITGSRAMAANRVSYSLDFTGPSLVIDAESCSGIACLEAAVRAIKDNQCEAAVVCVAEINLHPHFSVHYNRLHPLNNDGKSKCYDSNADGQTMSEAINVIFIQKYKDAKRVYAVISDAKVSTSGCLDYPNQEFGLMREPELLTKFLEDFYREAGVSPSLVEYVEGVGAGNKEVDKMELDVMDGIFCKDRSSPLLMGSVVSNIGYTHAAAGLSGIVKLLLAYNKGKIAGNLNYEEPRQDVASIREGRIRVITDDQPFKGSYTAINSLAISLMNGHALFQGVNKPKDLSKYHSELPYLVLASGRHDAAVKRILDDLKKNPLDPEEIGLIHEIFKRNTKRHQSRGFGIYGTNEQRETVALKESVDSYDDLERPLWFVYSGMGSQWAGMGAQLMRIPIFAAAIERCRKVLEPRGVDIIEIITSKDEAIFDNILNSFVGIAAIQIGLTDILFALGLVPDKIIGHSVGELGCAYADGCVTAEEMILLSYSRGLVSIQTELIDGSMAAIGLGHKQTQKLCPPEIEVACHNTPDSCTISGPAEAVAEFVQTMTRRDVFAKEVNCSHIAYHSRYIAGAGPGLLKLCSEVLKGEKLRSERWVSTSVPQDRWQEHAAKYSSAEYYTNNLLSPVLFEETSNLIPPNAVLVEIAPHGLLQALLKRSLPKSCNNISLTLREHPDNVVKLLEAIGQLYISGCNPDISILYPKIEFPVSTSTRPLSHLVQWMHEDKWICRMAQDSQQKSCAVYRPVVTIYDEDYQYLTGNVIEGSRILPCAAMLVAVWDTVAMTINRPQKAVSVQFMDIRVYCEPTLYDDKSIRLTISWQRGSGRFEVISEQGILVDGEVVVVAKRTGSPENALPINTSDNIIMELNDTDVYKLLYERGYQYKDSFRSICKADLSLNNARLKWKNNWVTFIDGLLQLNVLRCDHDGVSKPLCIKSLRIEVTNQCPDKIDEHGNMFIDATYDELASLTRCGGVFIQNVSFNNKPLKKQNIGLKSLKFVPFFTDDIIDMPTTFYIFMQIIAENISDEQLTVFDVRNPEEPSILDDVKELLCGEPDIKIKPVHLNADLVTKLQFFGKPDAVVLYDLLADKRTFEELYNILPRDSFIVSIGVDLENLYPASIYKVVSAIGTGPTRMELARWRPPVLFSGTTAISVNTSTDIDFLRTTYENLPMQQKLLILSKYPSPRKLRTLVKEWRQNDRQRQIYVVMINDNMMKDEDLEHLPTYHLAFNILNEGQCGGEYYVPIEERTVTGCNGELYCGRPGDLTSLQWVEAPKIKEPGILVDVYYAGLNSIDVNRAIGDINIGSISSTGFGMDFSGVTQRGERVMGLLGGGSLSSEVIAQPELLWPVPHNWSLEDAATVPFAYCLAFYCLAIKSNLHRGMKVLVHGGAGALGQAVISIALAFDCQVLTTVSDSSKKKFLQYMFPNLPAENIGYSKDATFAHMVKTNTKGMGCDIIICSMNTMKDVTCNCAGAFGVTLDLSQILNHDVYNFGLFYMFECKAYKLIDFPSLFNNCSIKEMKRLQLMVSEGIARGYVRPLSRITFAPMEVTRAFRLFTSRKHRGRLLIRMSDALPSLLSRINHSSTGIHLLICDEQSYSLMLVDRLVQNGVKQIHMNCKPSFYIDYKKRLWQKLGAEVVVDTENINNRSSIESLLRNCSRSGTLEAIYILPNTIDSTTLQDLDLISRRMCPSLRYFTVISHDDLGREACLDRANNGLPALSLQLPTLKQLDSEEASDKEEMVSNWRDAINVIEKAILSKEPIVHTYKLNVQETNLLEDLEEKFGIRTIDTPGATLEDIGIVGGRALELCNLLEEKYNIVMNKEMLPAIPVEQLLTLQDRYKNVRKEKVGFEVFLKHIDTSEESLDVADFSQMPTLAQNCITNSAECNSKYALCIVPGVEAHKNRFYSLCEILKIPAIVLQPGFDNPRESIQEMAQRLVMIMKKRLEIKDRFYLLGYEFGVLVALEMAAILESEGVSGTVYCLGGTPEDIPAIFETHLGDRNQDIVENNLIKHLYEITTGQNGITLDKFIQGAECWEDKILLCSRFFEKEGMNHQYLLTVLKAVYARIDMIRNYKPQLNLRSKIIVLRPLLPLLGEGKERSFSKETPIVHNLSSDISDSSQDLRCAMIINKSLEPDILEEYYNSNHCDVSMMYTMDFK